VRAGLVAAQNGKGRGVMKTLDYAIRTENWELAALCLVVGALKEMPAGLCGRHVGASGRGRRCMRSAKAKAGAR